MEEDLNSLQKTARLGGFLYFIMGVTGAYGLIYIPKQIVPGNIAATINNILSNEFLFRTGILSLLLTGVSSAFCVLVLYKLFKHIDKFQAQLMVVFVIVQIPIFFLIETFSVTTLMILKGTLLSNLAVTQQQDIALLLLTMHNNGILLLEVFWGLWLLPLGNLIYKSDFIPRFIGILLLLAGIGYVLDSLTSTLYPQYRFVTQPIAMTFSGIGELSIVLWLLIKGAKKRTIEVARAINLET